MIRSNDRRIGTRAGVLLAAAALVVTACGDETPTSIGEEVLPGAPVTLQLEIPWEDFGSNLEVFGGYGAPGDLGTGVLANAFDGSLNARTLLRFGTLPTSASVRDTTGTTVTDSDLTFVGGELVAVFSGPASSAETPVSLTLGFMDEAWHRRSATWTHAVDTLGNSVLWSQPGGGTVSPIDTVTWDPAVGDSVSFALDSAQVAEWDDVATRALGARIDLLTAGHRLDVRSVALRLSARPSVNPDTLVTVSASESGVTFIYDPASTAPVDGIRVGGAPAWRTVLDLGVPTQLTGPAELCAAAGCPVTLEPGQISFASLVLTTRQTDGAFQPLDTLGLDARAVLSRDALPKAPLGAPVVGSLGRRLPAAYFGDEAEAQVEIPITSLVRNILRGIDPTTGRPYPNSLALLSPFEPLSIAYGSFHGPGTGFAPVLKLIVTVGPSVELP
ncbi:MAG: hypothetical protein WD101_04255 [Gemmatimonadota bacterium]